MEKKWNFDFVFTGKLEDQGNKAAHFIGGLKKLIDDQEANLAASVVSPGDPRSVEESLGLLLDTEQCYLDFMGDPRVEALDKALGAEKHKKARENLNTEVARMLGITPEQVKQAEGEV